MGDLRRDLSTGSSASIRGCRLMSAYVRVSIPMPVRFVWPLLLGRNPQCTVRSFCRPPAIQSVNWHGEAPGWPQHVRMTKPPGGRSSRGEGQASRLPAAPGARRCCGHQHQAPAAAPAPPASGRVAPAAAAGLCRSGTPPLRPDTVRGRIPDMPELTVCASDPPA